MEETIKDIEVIAYKGMKSDMSCRYFQYEIGKTYKTDKVELCNYGFHACLNPRDVLYYYPKKEDSRYFKVNLSGEVAKCGDFDDTKVAATEITILEEINIDEVINNTEWQKTENVLDLLYYIEDFAKVQRGDGLYNFIDKQGNILSKEWFRYVCNFHEGFAVVQRENDLWNFLDKQGNYLSDKWFIDAYSFDDGFARVRRGDNLYNFIDKQGNYLSNKWFVYVDIFYDGFATIRNDDYLYNFIDKNGNYLSNEWFNWVGYFYDGFANVLRTNGERAKIDKIGKLHF